MLAAADAADAEEDETFDKDSRGDEMPNLAGDKQKWLAKIKKAMAALEAEAKLAAEKSSGSWPKRKAGRKKPG